MSELTTLDLGGNQVGDEGARAIAKGLTGLTSLYLRDNPVEKIPEEILDDITSLREYFNFESAHVDIEYVPNTMIKMILLGNTTAGKTALARYLVEGTFSEKKDSTHGIKYWRWEPDYPQKEADNNSNKQLQVNIWDFGGQDYYHATHNLFLEKKSLFLLLHTNKEVHYAECEEDEQFHLPDYWMGNIYEMSEGETLTEEASSTEKVKNKSEPGKGFHIWYVQNKSDHPKYQQEWLQSNYHVENQFHTSIKEAHAHSNENRSAPLHWQVFENSLKQRLSELARGEIPEFWAYIRDKALPKWKQEVDKDEGLKSLYITREEFAQRCKSELDEEGIHYSTENDRFLGLLTYLKGCGEVVYFEDNPALSDKVYLGSDTLTQYLFKEVLTKKVREQEGRILAENLADNENDITGLLPILREYELIFEDPKSPGTYVVPQFLPKDPHINRFMKLMPLSFALRFPVFMPRYFITRFISHYALKDDNAHYWRYGAFLELNGIHCLVRIDAAEQVVYVHAEDKKERFSVLQELFNFFTRTCFDLTSEKDQFGSEGRMSEIKSKERGLTSMNYLADHPRIERLELSVDGSTFASLENIRNGIEGKFQKVQGVDGGYVPINATLTQLLKPNAPVPKRIFLCYSHADEEELDNLRAHLSGPEMSGLIDIWYDRKIDGGQDWDETIRSELKSSDIVLLMLSHGFMKSRYIWETEIPVAKEASAEIVPIFLSPVYFKEDQHKLYTKQGFPRDAKFILGDAWNNKHEAYMKVAEGIVDLIRTT